MMLLVLILVTIPCYIFGIILLRTNGGGTRERVTPTSFPTLIVPASPTSLTPTLTPYLTRTPSLTPTATETWLPTATYTLVPTDTPVPTATPLPTDTPEPPTPTPEPLPASPTPTDLPLVTPNETLEPNP